MTESRRVLFTIGHSTRSFDGFVQLLRAHGVLRLADVRTVPRSRRHPHFSGDALAERLPPLGIAYRHFPQLGGLRRPRRDSPNGAWRNPGFRGYADHMQTPVFSEAVGDLLVMADAAPTCIMCAEAVWWRCHRALLADAVLVRGWEVRHIVASGPAQPHQLCEFARSDGTTITYGEDTPVLPRGHGNRS